MAAGDSEIFSNRVSQGRAKRNKDWLLGRGESMTNDGGLK